MKILNLGSLNSDNVYRVTNIVKPGETIQSIEEYSSCGGKGLNQSIAIAKAGMKISHAGAVGEDGDILIEILQRNNVDTSLIKKVEGKSGQAIIQVDNAGQNSILISRGANTKIDKEYIDRILEKYNKDDIVIVQNEINNVRYAIDKAFSKDMKIILNPSPLNGQILEMDLSKVDVLILNEVEGNQLTGKSSSEDILKDISEKYPNMAIILTLGEQGSIYKAQDGYHIQKAYHVNAVDTTAAGDTFCGYFIKTFFETSDAKIALEIAAKASAIAVTRLGAANSIPYWSEVINYSFLNPR